MAREGLAVRLLRPLPMVVALYAFALFAALQVYVVVHHFGGADFRGTLWSPGHDIRNGLSPYPGPSSSMAGSPSVYLPPPILAIGVPFSFLPFAIGAAKEESVAFPGGRLRPIHFANCPAARRA